MGFFAAGALKRLDLGGGAPQTLAPADNGSGGTWNTDGVIVFAPSANVRLMRVSATGGAAAAVTTLGPQQQGHALPSLSARWPPVPVLVHGAAGHGRDLPGRARRERPDPAERPPTAAGAPELSAAPAGGCCGCGRARLWPSGWIVAQAALRGEPVTLADGGVGLAVSVAATGLVAYRSRGGSQRQLTWFDRSGTARGTVGDPDGNFSNPRVSPDGRRVVVERTVQGNTDLWLLDGARTSRFTFDAAADRFPIWSPDGTRLAFRSNRTSLGDLYQKLTSGAGVEERFVASDQLKAPSSWSADGRFLLYLSDRPANESATSGWCRWWVIARHRCF